MRLVFETETELLVGRIVETEAYLGQCDRAAHSFGGRRTARNNVMYGPPGFAYVFFIYGMHFHVNLVTDAKEIASAVLIRAVEPECGESSMRERRRFPKQRRHICNGPGKVCEAFGIRRDHNGIDLCHPPLYLSDGERPRRVQRCPRVGVDYAGAWARRLLRFVDAESQFLSVPPRKPQRRAS